MHNMETAYAQALWKMISGGETPKKVIASLYETLKRHRREALLPRIARAFRRLAMQARARDMLTLSIADEHATRAKKEAKEILEMMHVDLSEVEVRTDPTLIGGWRLEGREHLYDASYKKFLLDVYNRATGTV